jgi:hypothetical protein
MDFTASVWIGFDHREAQAFAVCRHSIRRRLTQPIPVKGIVLSDLERMGVYKRPWERRGEAGQLWDLISEAPQSTEFAITRFLTPLLAKTGWALFLDCDILARCSIARMFELVNPKYAVMCVKHNHIVPAASMKMDGQLQVPYSRKNWSSVMLFNVDHPSNRKLTHELINTVPGRDLHRFCWLEDEEIGELDPEWNYLVGHTKIDHEPKLVHFTDGVPFMRGYEHCEYADDYRRELELWAAA